MYKKNPDIRNPFYNEHIYYILFNLVYLFLVIRRIMVVEVSLTSQPLFITMDIHYRSVIMYQGLHQHSNSVCLNLLQCQTKSQLPRILSLILFARDRSKLKEKKTNKQHHINITKDTMFHLNQD